MKKWLGWKQVALVLGAFIFVVLILQLTGVAPWDVFAKLFTGSFGSWIALSGTLEKTTPLLLAGLAVYIALRAGLFNIGAEGQLLVGGVAAAYVALRIPNALGMCLAVVAGCVAGGLWAWPAGAIKAYRDGHEVITTIMLNSVAVFLTLYLVREPLKNPDQQSATTSILDPATHLPAVVDSPNFPLSSAFPIALLIVILAAVWLKRTVPGYELRATGSNKTAAAVAGVNVKRVTVRAMVGSGALAGLAGAFQVLAYDHRFFADFGAGRGFDALGVALLAGQSPAGVIPAALLFGALSQGMPGVQFIGVPHGLAGILLGLIIIVFAVFRYRRRPSNG